MVLIYNYVVNRLIPVVVFLSNLTYRKKNVVSRTIMDKLSFFSTRLDEQDVSLFVSLIRFVGENGPAVNYH
jgi:hypothetical protein